MGLSHYITCLVGEEEEIHYSAEEHNLSRGVLWDKIIMSQGVDTASMVCHGDDGS